MGDDGKPEYRIGLIADPDFPEQLTEHLTEELPKHLHEGREWIVESEVDPVTAGRYGVPDILRAAGERLGERNWDYVVCVTDLPLRRDARPVLAELDLDQGVAVVSLPALGGTQPYRRARQMIVQLLDEFTACGDEPASGESDGQRHGLQSTLTSLVAPIHRETANENGDVDVRYIATRQRGRIRLLTGMVRTNRPWRLVFGLSSALAAALATSAFGLSSSTIWQIGDQLGVGRQLVAAVASLAVLVFWLIIAHGLWERRRRRSAPDREQIVLYNLSTVLTLVAGVCCMYLLLFVVNFAVAWFLVPNSLLASSLGHPAAWTTYLTMAWGFTTMGIVAGAVGTSFESDQAVRQAAYGYREEQRRREIQRERDRRGGQ